MPHQFIKNRDIVLFSFQPWNAGIAFNFRDMAFELARFNRVLFIDRARDRNTILKGKLSGAQKSSQEPYLEQVQDNFWVLHPKAVLESGNWSPSYTIFNFFNRINNRRIALEIKTIMRKLDFKNSLLINDNDFYRGLYLKSMLPVREYIFYLRDFLTVQPYFEKFGPRCEMEMFLRADLVVANSAYLADYAGQWNPFSANIGQGCQLDAFLVPDLPRPSDMDAIPGPIIGYCGALTAQRLDEDILLYIADSLPLMSLVLLGPVEGDFGKQLREKKNVFFLGSRKPEETAAYIRHFTVCINPQLLNPLTLGNYPRKIDEYLASGKPVVATATPAMEMFRDYVALCESGEAYVNHIMNYVQDPVWNSSEWISKRIHFAKEHSWEHSIGALGEAYYSLDKKNKPARYE